MFWRALSKQRVSTTRTHNRDGVLERNRTLFPSDHVFLTLNKHAHYQDGELDEAHHFNRTDVYIRRGVATTKRSCVRSRRRELSTDHMYLETQKYSTLSRLDGKPGPEDRRSTGQDATKFQMLGCQPRNYRTNEHRDRQILRKRRSISISTSIVSEHPVHIF